MIISKIKERIKSYVHHFIPLPAYCSPSYSQAGEDRILYFLFSTKNPAKKVSYLDVGAYNAIINSNTYLFYKNGACGVLVEADPALTGAIQHARPRDKVIQAAVAGQSGLELPFFRMNVPSGNTLVPNDDEGCNRTDLLTLKDSIKLTTVSLNDLLLNNFDTCPDILSLDIEGVDLAALMSIDYERFPIPAICVETCAFSGTHVKPKDLTISEFLAKKGYFVYADTYINTIFVNSSWFFEK